MDERHGFDPGLGGAMSLLPPFFSGLLDLRAWEQWPREPIALPVPSRFTAEWVDTLFLLDTELRQLGAYGQGRPPAVLRLGFESRDLYKNGKPKPSAVPTNPGVILEVESRRGPLAFPCDTFVRWQDNTRAVALGLEGLRRLDRYGITPNGEQYEGWMALEDKAARKRWSPAWAEEHLRREAANGDEPVRGEPLAKTYRKARAATHPDRNAGDQARWDTVERAARVLREAGRL